MKTEISNFCKEYQTILQPLTEPLNDAIHRIENESRNEVFQIPLAGLIDVSHRLKTLADKIEHQQAYLLIFGPLKSGKSTLMNAISGTYVSEVTSMPAYPALVYVSHGDKQEFNVTRYNGSKMAFKDNDTLQTIISDSHSNLAEHIRLHEERGEEFDPGIHYPEAIRRIDIQLPVSNLKESSTVLVDTPGLYSRMKFGYDLMTRVFRNSAACAVFVVKTDNLFLEQVFAEFNELLDLFSRIFLVVNIDTGKKDLQRDGSLLPSLESEDPEKIIDAFEALAMSAPLRRAFEEGRLRIYPIDLLTSASAFLRKELSDQAKANASATEEPTPGPANETRIESDKHESEESEDGGELEPITKSATGEGTVEEEEIVEGPPQALARPAGSTSLCSFEDFLKDLTEYLNSNSYLIEFMRDSLRQGATLCEEIKSDCQLDHLSDFQKQQKDLETQIKAVRDELEAISELESIEFKSAFDKVREENDRQTAEAAKKIKDQAALELMKALNQWFESDDSLIALQDKYWNPILRKISQTISQDTITRIQSILDKGNGGADLSINTTRALSTIHCSLSDIFRPLVDRMNTESIPTDCTLKLEEKSIPVRKTFLDWILFRRQPSIRQRLFGAPDVLDQRIPSDVKKKRLLPDGKQAMADILNYHIKTRFPKIPAECSSKILNAYIDEFCGKFTERLVSEKKGQVDRQSSLEAHASTNKRIIASIETLRSHAEGLESEIEALTEQYHCAPEPAPELEAHLGEDSDWESEGEPSETSDTGPEQETSLQDHLSGIPATGGKLESDEIPNKSKVLDSISEPRESSLSNDETSPKKPSTSGEHPIRLSL